MKNLLSYEMRVGTVLLFFAFAIVMSTTTLTTVQAATVVWTDADAGNSSWHDGDNWSLGVVPGPSDTAVFDDDGGGMDTAPVISAPVSIGKIQFNTGYTAAGGVFDFNTQTISFDTESLGIDGSALVATLSLGIDGATLNFDHGADLSNLAIGTNSAGHISVGLAGNAELFTGPASGAFYDLTVEGTTTLSGVIDVDRDFSATGTNLGTSTISVARIFTGDATVPGTSSIVLDGLGGQSVFGGPDVYNFTVADTSVPRTINFEANTTLTIHGLFVSDHSPGNIVSYQSSVFDEQFVIDLLISGGASYGTIDFIGYADAHLKDDGVTKSPALDPPNPLPGPNTAGWTSSGLQSNCWTDASGSTSNWSDPANWSLGHVPTASEQVCFDDNNGGTDTAPVIDVSVITVSSIDFRSGYTAGGATFDWNGATVTATASSTNLRTLNTEAIAVSPLTVDMDGATFVLSGSAHLGGWHVGSNATGALTVGNSGTGPFVFDAPASGTLSELITKNAVTISGDFTTGILREDNGGVLTLNNNTITITKELSNVAGGTVQSGDATVVLDAQGQDMLVAGSMDLHNLVMNDPGITGRSIDFQSGAEITVNGVLTIDGNPGTELTLRGNGAHINMAGGSSYGATDNVAIHDFGLYENGIVKNPALNPFVSTYSGSAQGWFDLVSIEFETDFDGDDEDVGGNLARLIINGTLPEPVDIDLTLDAFGDAEVGTDYTFAGYTTLPQTATLTIPAGSYTSTTPLDVAGLSLSGGGSVGFSVVSDIEVEDNETIRMILSNLRGNLQFADVSGGSVITNHVYTINNDDADITPPPTPTVVPDLLMASDSGSSDVDNYTADSTPTINVECTEVAAVVNVYSASSPVATHVCGTVGIETVTISSPISDSLHVITYTNEDAAGNESVASPQLILTIDTIAPSVPTIDAPTDGNPVSGAAEVGSQVTVTTQNGSTCVVEQVPGTGLYSCALVPAPVDGEDISAIVDDSAGNTSLVTLASEGISLVASLPSTSVYRFYSEAFRGHFYTSSEGERDFLIANDSNWRYEGEVYTAFASGDATVFPVYRFWSESFKGHFYTISEGEKDALIANDPNWAFEGEQWYAYTTQQPNTTAIYRFWSEVYKHHFYTSSLDERDSVIANDPNWMYEGEAYFVPL